MRKILIIRFSSFGDVLQCLSVAGALKSHFPDGEIHWVTREEFAPLIATHPAVAKVWILRRTAGWKGLLRLAWELRRRNFTHVYDAHNNLRSRVIGWILCRLGGARLLRRSIYRWRRFLLFRFRINKFPKPFNGQADLLRPLIKWGVALKAPEVPQLFVRPETLTRVRTEIEKVCSKKFVALAPSAAFPLKRWPMEHWRALIQAASEVKFLVLGGPGDEFLEELAGVDRNRVFSFVGRWSLEESAAAVQLAQAMVANDTGLLHVAEQLGVPCIALMGPAPFGFPSRPRTKILELDLYCRPCSKHGQGPCVNPEFQKCLRDISPVRVNEELQRILSESGLGAGT
jgi:ADP-heptose:LPS heptosyltransferase